MMNKILPLFHFLFLWLFVGLSAQHISPAFQCHNKGKNALAPLYHVESKQVAPGRSDTFDIRNYSITLDYIDFAKQSIQGHCAIDVNIRKGPVDQIPLDLLHLQVDSVTVDQQTTTFQYNDTLLQVDFPSALNQGETPLVTVYYHGLPVTDPSGWGGFYFQGQQAFNLGVGFRSKPHNYGRAWFPCFDNFTERSTYDFHIRTDTSHKAFCNGLLQNKTHDTDSTVIWHWTLSQTIPTYLASMAVAPYTTLSMQYTGSNGQSIPIRLGALPSDTSDLKASFAHLPDAFDAFEHGYGPFLWERAGFVLVPFNGGAMEHATNIAYPASAADSSLARESLMAHEFAHNWWGNLVTCQDAKDMWINEGWATYSEALFFEHVYGPQRYREYVRSNHRDVLQYAHIRDNGYRAIHGIPHAYTYGDHVYNKGADVAHTMRGYLQDSVFFDCLNKLIAAHAFANLSSEKFRDFMSNCTGRSFGKFFDQWVFQKGFPHFAIEQVASQSDGNGGYDVEVQIRQRLKKAPELYEQVPLEISFFNANRNVQTEVAYMSGQCGIYKTNLAFDPVYTALDYNEQISDATTDHPVQMDTAKSYRLPETFATIDVRQVRDAALLRVIHHWVGAEAFQADRKGLHLSTERYWTIEGIMPKDFSASATFTFNGQSSLNGGYLDNKLITNKEDSLVMMYRPSPTDTWSEVDSFQVKTGFSKNDKRGEVVVNDLRKGDYALAIYDFAREDTFQQSSPAPCKHISSTQSGGRSSKPGFQLFPNPATQNVKLSFEGKLSGEKQLAVFDMAGRAILTKDLASHQQTLEIDTSNWEKGIYFLSVQQGALFSETRKLVVVE